MDRRDGDPVVLGELLDRETLRDWIPQLVAMPEADLTALPGVSPNRTHQIVPGALVAEALMDIFELPTLAICPWALREGVILERIDRLGLVDGPEGI